MIQLKDICDIYDCPHTTAKDEGKGYPLVRTPNVGKGRLILDGIHRVSEDVYNSRNARAIPEEGDLILAREAPVGNVSIIMDGQRVCLGQRVVLIKPKRELVDPHFLTYYLLSAEVQHRLKNHANGAVVAHLNVSDIRNLWVTLPELEEQVAIGKILRSIDDKIELNRQINDNLEQQAQALYKSWFIDNYQTEWPEYSLDEVTLKITDGVHNTVIDTPNGEYYLLSCKNIKNRRLNMSSSDRRIDEGTFNKLRKRTMLSKGDILLSSVGTIGELMLLNDDPHNYEFQRSVAIIKPNPVYISSYYLYETLISQIDKITNTAHGAVQQCIFLSDLKEYTINIADKALISRYDIIVKPFFDEITKREKEIARLTSLRDSLLPKLMSGELKINEIDC